ncbi:MAG: hydantoinase/oxoprolinase family protein [bacterium]
MTDSKGTDYIVYLDTGGTFSDAVVVDSKGRFVSGKSATTPDDLAECFFGCIQDAARKLDLSLSDLLSRTRILGFGTTAGTNALITRVGGPRLGLICTKGVEDTTIIMRMEGRWAGRPQQETLHNAGTDKPEPLIPRERIHGVTERVDSKGRVAIPLVEEEVRQAVGQLLNEGVEGIAVCFLWSFLNDVHEKRTRELIREMAPDLPVSLSAEVAPIIREYPRFMSTIIDLFIGRPVQKLFSTIGKRLSEHGYTRELLVMKASGGLSRSDVVRPITTLHSGPVGGLLGVEYLKQLYQEAYAVGTDMGGTSFDLSLTKPTGWEYIKTPVVARFTLANPMLGIEAIGAGGGTIASLDPTSSGLRIGPNSAGAVPGPVCYDKGGTEPTVTDADLVLNRINPDFFLDGEMPLNREKAYAVVRERIATPLGFTPEEAALGIVQSIDGIMQSAIRVFLSWKGVDPRQAVLFSFGGAGPTHCAGYTQGLEVKRVIIPPFASTFSAFGASTADVTRRYDASPYLVMPDLPYDITRQRFDVRSLESVPANLLERFNRTMEWLEDRVVQDMAREGFSRDELQIRYFLDMRYGGQLNEITCRAPIGRIREAADFQAILEAFEGEYVRLFHPGTQYPKGGAEIITVTVEAAAPPIAKPVLEPQPHGGSDPSKALKGRRKVLFPSGWLETNVYASDQLMHGYEIAGPSILEGNDTTVVVPETHRITVDAYRNFFLEART